jgi:outer membrane protein TolC
VKGTPQLVAALRQQLPDVVPEAKVFVKELQQGQVMEAPVEVRIVGKDIPTLETLGNQVQGILEHTPGATYVHTDWHEDAWQMGVNVRQEVANRMGLTNAAISQQLAVGFEGAPVTTFWEGDRGVDVVLRLDPAERQSFQDVADTYVTSPVTGAKVPLSAVASLSPDWQPGRIVRRNGVRTLSVRAFPSGKRLASEILGDARKQINNISLPPGYSIEYGGESENKLEVSGEMRNALLISMVLIFLILLFQFRSLADPLIVMAAFPLALPGAALGLLVTNNTFGFTAFIGVVSVGGLAVRNSIILIDYIYERIKNGAELEQASLEAGERRLRPIFLTSAAAAVGVIPMIISGSSLWSPLASVIAFGLLGSMFFTLIAIPVLFVVVHHRLRARAQAKAVVAVLLACFALTSAANAETRRITLDEAVTLATKQNSIVKMARLKTKEMDAKVTQARANYFPVLSNDTSAAHLQAIEHLEIPMGTLGVYSSTGPIPGEKISLPLGRHNFVLSTTTAAQPLTQYFKIHAGVAAAHADASIARSNARQAENEVALKMKQLYFTLLSAERRHQAAELTIEAGEERLAEARHGVEAGAVLQLKVLDGRAQIADARHKLGSLEDAISDMKVEFNDLTGLPLDTDVELVEPPVDHSDVTAGDLETEAIQHNPEVAAARDTLAKAKAGLAAAHAAYIPEIGAFAQYIHQDGVPLLTENNGGFGLKMNWTLVEFGKRRGKVHESQAQVAEAEENLRHAESRVRVEMEKSVRKVRRAETGLEAARESVEARQEMQRITVNQVEAKTVNASALKEATAQLAEAQAQLFQAEAERSTARAELARTLGQE